MSLLVTGCGVDSSAGSGDEDGVAQYTVIVAVQPPTSLRTEETIGLWTSPVEATFTTNFVTSEADDDTEESHKTAAIADGADGDAGDGHQDRMHVGSMAFDDIGVRVEALPAMTLWHWEEDGFEQVTPHAEETHHVMVFVEDMTGDHAPEGNAPIPGATVHVGVTIDGQEQRFEMHPVQGDHGVRYEANAAIPMGMYDLTMHVTPPDVMDDATKSRWNQEIEATMQGIQVGTGGGQAEVGGMMVTLSTASARPYGRMGTGMQSMSAEEKVNLSIELRDEHAMADGAGEPIVDSVVTMTIVNDETGVSQTHTLPSMHGEAGFHFGANLGLPQDAAADHDDDDDDH